ncbi:SDR family NAD(P)-dependent oxidoreductase [Gallaecimonas sp. GXIMD4217]|uniref:SDR family NAD(P)-dependent oxidoreductase n=1 Tax=Gallaecimonas sp. GXIMD4217 TaxID=3131927 RepID=UPI00311B3C18
MSDDFFMVRNILISGASRGIGLAIARHLSAQGHRLSLGIRSGQPPADLAQHHCFAYDASRGDEEAWLASARKALGPVDTLVHCAGVLEVVGLLDDFEAPLERMLEVNLKAPWRLTRAAWEDLRAHGQGRVISLVSLSGKRVKGLSAGYSASKFAQLALHQAIRNTGWEDGIRATAICPSWVNTDMAAANCPLEPDTLTQPDDIAALVDSILALPNSAVVDEIAVNCRLEP